MNPDQDTILKILQRKFPQLAELPLQKEIAANGKLLHFRSGEMIMNSNSFIKFIPLIVNGSIKVTREEDKEGKEVLLYFLSEGETCSFSFTCCMMNKKSMIKSIAVEDSIVIAIPSNNMDKWMSKYQSWKNFVMLSYDNKMIDLVKSLDSIAFEDTDKRLKKYLKARTTSTQSNTILATHQELANDLNVSREAISRLLKKLENLGEVELGRNQIKVTF